ncbi:MAG: hypothetical protein EWV75_14720 [Microcystis wesenbergii Mw_QC_S_20081001_S30D]|jgi:hypothetical protein|uniref:Uncharacterized protein n=1 Tax=Microcystis wesenbergii Mw_QC_S_20081001_S30D TaxID=2486245 RepID=A0A552JGK0_9CHRO|nr:hypothetical protein [Microcystis aeruginosa W11-03]NCR92562.1 hypothetical protein [Microcystis aeruginosa W11-06]TRU94899.1 MAG: hypothetical protein EWV75_14720 [Microcystis wesenbergii Mw_QC_S_20081001_S30D]TRU97405.1 MAG: hypothetical protein EWV73_16800 [Microcystis wesenbergii Mw_QC_B_20070930_S4D]TRV02829.1 MAG: hypothetical protein EWV74_08190 [Microcystis wesenbergii Mw_QC_S_20081001_S30]TRV12304.1 MAG: hypothetical protein EWV89_13330 [Microcystis wesenbergii Mw_QC_B_20070930_S4]
MSDIAMLKEMIKDCAIVELEYQKEYKRDSYLLKLTEPQDNYSFVVNGMPKPDEVIVIKLDDFFDVRKIFTGSKGECKRADFIIIANTPTEKVILCLEMKKGKDSNTSIIKQLKGAKCFVSYCREIGRSFWNKLDFLQDYQYRFVSIKNISISKTTTSSPKFSQKSEIHDQPEKMLKISAKAKHFQELI